MNTPRYPIAPKLAAPISVSGMLKDVLIALLPAFVMSFYLFGWRVLLLGFLSMATCGFWQYIYGRGCHRLHPISDPSPYVTGLLLTMCYPVDLPLWAVPIGSFFGIFVVKELYGGLGCNFLNPALGGRMFLASSPLLMTKFSQPLPMERASEMVGVDVISTATPMAYLSQGLLPSYGLDEVFLGFHGGSLGEGSSLMLLLGGIYLILRRVITPTIPITFLGTVALGSYLFPPTGIEASTWMFYQLWSGGLILGAFFMATDPVTSPVSPQSQVVFGMGCGMMTLLLRYFGNYPEGVGFAILTMNGLVWLLDVLGAPRRFAGEHFAITSQVLRGLWNKIRTLRIEKPSFLKESKLKNEVKKVLPEREEGTVPGENVLDQLPDALKSLMAFVVVCIITIGSISWTYTLTLLPIYRAEEAIYQDLLTRAMPKGNFMSETPYQTEMADKLYAVYSNQDHIGYGVQLTEHGFQGDITLLVGVDLNGAVTGIAVLEANESILIGEEALTPDSLSRFYGRSGKLSFSGYNSVDLMSGATVTMEGILNCVNRALEVVKDLDSVNVLENLENLENLEYLESMGELELELSQESKE